MLLLLFGVRGECVSSDVVDGVDGGGVVAVISIGGVDVVVVGGGDVGVCVGGGVDVEDGCGCCSRYC